jgi:hypothetical protein
VGDDVNRGFTLAETFTLLTDTLGQTAEANAHDAFQEFRKLAGCGVPAAQKLCTHSNPIARAYAILLLQQVEATIGKPDVQRLATDTTRVPALREQRISSGLLTTSIAKLAGSCLRSLADSNDCQMWVIAKCVIQLQSLVGIEELHPDLTTGIQHYALRDKLHDGQKRSTEETLKIYAEVDWDTWWRAAGPVWKIWNETNGGKKSFTDREAFHNGVRRRTSRVTLQRTKNADGSSLLRVAEPVGGFCTVSHNGVLVAYGPIPFETTKTDPRSMTVKATAPDAKPWEVTLASNVGSTFVVRFYKERLD